MRLELLKYGCNLAAHVLISMRCQARAVTQTSPAALQARSLTVPAQGMPCSCTTVANNQSPNQRKPGRIDS